MDPIAPNPSTPASPVKLILVWLVVGVPALWGVSKTVQTSLNLFRTPPAVTAPAVTPATAPAASQPA